MATITAFPAITPTTSQIGILYNTKVFRSPLTGAIQTATREGARWQMQLMFNNLNESERSVMRGYLAFMNGQENRVEVGDHAYTGARGALGGTALVNGATQTGTQLITDGWPNSTVVLKAGDYFSFTNGTNKEFKMVTSDVTSDGSGNATINCSPEIHTSPADNASIETAAPVGTFYLAEPAVNWDNMPSQFGGVASPRSSFTVSLIEDIL